MRYAVRIHREAGTYWAEVPELPGAFAAATRVGELLEGLEEAVTLYLGKVEGGATVLEFELTVAP